MAKHSVMENKQTETSLHCALQMIFCSEVVLERRPVKRMPWSGKEG
jgi:hypothetical protein